MAKILIMCELDPRSDPRPNRMINWLKKRHDLTVISGGKGEIDNITSIYPHLDRSSEISKRYFFGRSFKLNAENFIVRILKFFIRINLFIDRFLDDLIFKYELKRGIFPLTVKRRLKYLNFKELEGKKWDLIITHDLSLLPLAIKLKQNWTKVFFDAREFYPRQTEDQLWFIQLIQPLNNYLLKKYIHDCDLVFTVSESLVNAYNNQYGIQTKLLLSLPTFYQLHPIQVSDNRIRMIYHGIANPSRRIDNLIQIMDYLDERFFLDLMILPVGSKYYYYLQEMVNIRQNVRIIHPVQYDDIIPFTNQYDIGILFFQPTNFNLKYSLANKFFEYIMARLCLACSPNIEYKRFIMKYKCGILSDDYDLRSMAKALNALKSSDVYKFKERSDLAAKELNENQNMNRINEIIDNFIS